MIQEKRKINFSFPQNIAKYWQDHFNAGLQIFGVDTDGRVDWLGSKESWNKLISLEKIIN